MAGRPFSTQDILSYVETYLRRRSGLTGATRARLQQFRPGSPQFGRMPERRALFEELTNAPKPDRVNVPVHPAQAVDSRRLRAAEARRRYDSTPTDPGTPQSGDLTPVEIAWLQRLPQDPAEVTFDDAVQLAELALRINPQKNPASARLVDSVWAGVRDHHDQRIAQAQIQRAKSSLPDLPRNAHAALTEALGEEQPGLPERERSAQALDLLNGLRNRLQTEQAGTVRQAQQQLDQIAAAQRERSATTRDELKAGSL